MDLNQFETLIDALDVDVSASKAIAVAVSGGPDSMALCTLLVGWCAERGIALHALSVDHNLREESAAEAEQVRKWLKAYPDVQHHILKWEEPSDTSIQEEARNARYALMAEYCKSHGIAHLFMAHHMDDQAETVLFRLAKGSGLDGLAGMNAVQIYDDHLSVMRPLLDVSKHELIGFCDENAISYFKDPSNENSDFARVRLRQSRAVLEGEGLSNKRLSLTAKRMMRARKALDLYAEDVYRSTILKIDTKCIVFNFKLLRSAPEEIQLRCLFKGFAHFDPTSDYGPRMEKVEALLYDLRHVEKFRKRTLGGVILERDDRDDRLILVRE